MGLCGNFAWPSHLIQPLQQTCWHWIYHESFATGLLLDCNAPHSSGNFHYCDLQWHKYASVGEQHNVQHAKYSSAAPHVPLFCSYHILTSSVIYYWTDARQLGIYLLNREWYMGARRYGISVVRAFNSTAHEWALKVSDVSAADWLYQHTWKNTIFWPLPQLPCDVYSYFSEHNNRIQLWLEEGEGEGEGGV